MGFSFASIRSTLLFASLAHSSGLRQNFSQLFLHRLHGQYMDCLCGSSWLGFLILMEVPMSRDQHGFAGPHGFMVWVVTATALG